MTTQLGDDIVATVEQDTVVTVHYTGTFLDRGQVFDTSEGGEPLGFLVGHGNMIDGFEHEILGAAVGESRQFTLTPDRAYGERDDDAIQSIPLAEFPPDIPLEVGIVLGAQSDHGPIQFTVVAINDDSVTVDFNHQMAGKSLGFAVEVVSVRAALPEELEHGHAHGPGHHHH